MAILGLSFICFKNQLFLGLCRMGPAATISHTLTEHLLPIIPLPGIESYKEIQFMDLVFKGLTPAEETRCNTRPHPQIVPKLMAMYV